MKIVATYIMYDSEVHGHYKLHECIGVNSFLKSYYAEYENGKIGDVRSEEARELIENSGQ